MKDNGLSLFNTANLRNQEADISHGLNQRIKNRGFQLSLAETRVILEQREETMQSYQLVDFSVQTLFYMTERLSDDVTLTKSGLLRTLVDCQEIYYYLHSLENSGVSDEALLEQIFEAYDNYSGDMERVRGYFEDYRMGGQEDEKRDQYAK